MKSILAIFFIFLSNNLFASVKEWQLSFQNPATDLMQKVISLHNGILIDLVQKETLTQLQQHIIPY
jgi:hypothetical protein